MTNSIISIAISIVLLISFLNTANSQEKADDIIGKWYTANKSVVQIYKNKSKYYGKMIWLQEPNDENGNSKKDKNNPNKDLQNRTIKGTVFMNFVYDKDSKWYGEIYNFRDGKIYNANIEFSDMNTLKLRGYLGFSWLGKTVIWVRKK